jgi:uncharacterized protein (TIGR02300 family)
MILCEAYRLPLRNAGRQGQTDHAIPAPHTQGHPLGARGSAQCDRNAVDLNCVHLDIPLGKRPLPRPRGYGIGPKFPRPIPPGGHEMPKEEWGVKRVCPTTGKRFYDLNRDPVISPYTGEVVPVDTGTKTRVLVADKADAESEQETAEDDLLIDDDDDLDADDVSDDDDTMLDDDDDGDTVSLDELGGDVADNSNDDE